MPRAPRSSASPDHGILPVRALVRGDGFGNLAPTENTGLRPRHRLLEDQRDFVATNVAHLPLGKPRKIGGKFPSRRRNLMAPASIIVGGDRSLAA